jgi:hypothetical protein
MRRFIGILPLFFSISCVTAPQPTQPAPAEPAPSATTTTSGPGGMEIRRATGVEQQKTRCRNPNAKAQRQAAPTAEAGVAQPIGAPKAGPHAYTRYEDCP